MELRGGQVGLEKHLKHHFLRDRSSNQPYGLLISCLKLVEFRMYNNTLNFTFYLERRFRTLDLRVVMRMFPLETFT